MTPIQIGLLLLLLAAFLLYWKVLQNRFLNRLLLVGAFLLTLFFVSYPNASTSIAHLVGVGRGTDLILYLGIITLVFILLLMYSKIKKLEEMVTTLLRDKALQKNGHDHAG